MSVKKLRKWLLAFFNPNESLLLFLVGTSALTIFLAIVYDTVKEFFGLSGAWILASQLLLIVVGVISIQYIIQRKRGQAVLVAENIPDKKKGLILLLSPKLGSSIAAIEYHLPELRALWLITTKESADTAAMINKQFSDKIRKIHWGNEYEVDANEAKPTFNVVKSILLSAHKERIFRPQIIADITGGTKPMSAGMTLACLAYDVDIQYIKSQRDDKGQIDYDTRSVPIQLDLNIPLQKTLTHNKAVIRDTNS